MRTETAGEQSVSICDVDLHARAAARSADRTRDNVAPCLDVAFGVAHNGRLAGRAGRGVNARDFGFRNGEHAEGVVVAQVRLDRERKLREILKVLERVRPDPRSVELGAIVRHILVGMPQRPCQTLALKRADLLAGRDFMRIKRGGFGCQPIELTQRNLNQHSLPILLVVLLMVARLQQAA